MVIWSGREIREIGLGIENWGKEVGSANLVVVVDVVREGKYLSISFGDHPKRFPCAWIALFNNWAGLGWARPVSQLAFV